MKYFKEGEIYKIRHLRKGKFCIRVKSQCEEWLTGEIVEGIAGSILSYNEKGEGENITVRKNMIKLV